MSLIPSTPIGSSLRKGNVIFEALWNSPFNQTHQAAQLTMAMRPSTNRELIWLARLIKLTKRQTKPRGAIYARRRMTLRISSMSSRLRAAAADESKISKDCKIRSELVLDAAKQCVPKVIICLVKDTKDRATVGAIDTQSSQPLSQ